MFVTERMLSAGLVRELRACAVFVQSRHGKPAVARNFFRIVHRDQAIRVARVSDHKHAHIGRSIFLNRLTLPNENLAIDPEQILTFHARLAWHASDQQGPIHVAKTFIEIGRRCHRFKERETRNRPVPSPRLRARRAWQGSRSNEV